MKKLLLTLFAGVITLSVQATDYTYLTFETTDGTKASVSVESLNITISGTTLTAGTETFELSNLKKMYFSATDETTSLEMTMIDSGEILEAYDLQGHQVSKDQMRKGIYVIKAKRGTHKLIVR